MSRLTRPGNRVALPGRLSLAPRLLTALALALALPALEARGDSVTSLGFTGVVQYTQTVNDTPGTNPQAFYASDLNYSNSGDVTAASGASGAVASGQTSFSYGLSGASGSYQSSYITPTQLSDYMKQGTDFTANISGGSLGTQSGSVTYGASLFPSVVPYLTGSTYSALQNLDASQALTLSFNGYTAAGGASSSQATLVIYNPSNDDILYDDSFSPGTTSAVLAANTLAASTTYDLVLDYSNTVSTTVSGSDAAFNGATFTAQYHDRDFLSFTTAAPSVVPEPASLALMAVGLASTILIARRRRQLKTDDEF